MNLLTPKIEHALLSRPLDKQRVKRRIALRVQARLAKFERRLLAGQGLMRAVETTRSSPNFYRAGRLSPSR